MSKKRIKQIKEEIKQLRKDYECFEYDCGFIQSAAIYYAIKRLERKIGVK
jgi:hypothetical protein